MILFYQEPPPPPPEPPPDDPPPELLEDGLEDIELDAVIIVEFTKFPNVAILNVLLPLYQSGDCKFIVSNFLIHLSDTPKT